jgi:hypothetical protein
MSRFFGTGVNGRGNVVSFGGRGNAGQIHLRGWDAGVKVVPAIEGGKDAFHVYMTSGSHASARDVLLGIVHDTPDGPEWEAASLVASSADAMTVTH